MLLKLNNKITHFEFKEKNKSLFLTLFWGSSSWSNQNQSNLSSHLLVWCWPSRMSEYSRLLVNQSHYSAWPLWNKINFINKNSNKTLKCPIYSGKWMPFLGRLNHPLAFMKKPRTASPVSSATAAVVFPLSEDLAFTMCIWKVKHNRWSIKVIWHDWKIKILEWYI